MRSDGRVAEPTLVQLRDSLLNIKHEIDRLDIRYPVLTREGHEWAAVWIEFLSTIAIFSEKGDLKEAREYSVRCARRFSYLC